MPETYNTIDPRIRSAPFPLAMTIEICGFLYVIQQDHRYHDIRNHREVHLIASK